MKRLIMTTIGIVLLFFTLSQSEAAIYVVKEGDTLSKIAKLTGHKVSELMVMNWITEADYIRIGERITYIAKKDAVLASRFCFYIYCRGEREELEILNVAKYSYLLDWQGDYWRFSNLHSEILSRKYQYYYGNNLGAHYEMILDFSRAWLKLSPRAKKTLIKLR